MSTLAVAPSLPPSRRSHAALGLTAAAALGWFELQTCRVCGAVQYPPREACARCLSVELEWRPQSDRGELLSRTTLSHSNEPFFRQRLPWAIGLIKLDCGPSVVAHLHGSLTSLGMPVRVELRLDRAGCAVLVAFPREEVSEVSDYKLLSELSCDPRARKVLVTDATTPLGVELVRALSEAGASLVWAGHSGAATAFDGLSNVVPLPLDVKDDASVVAAAASVGGDADILINTAQRVIKPDEGTPGIDSAQLDMDLHCFGLMRLAREFAPRLRGRNTAAEFRSVAWVNLLSVHALSSAPGYEGFAASQAAARSVSQSLRAQMLGSGIRVVNVFASPFGQLPHGLAGAIITALRRGTEDVYPGEVAASWFAKYRENPKGLEREIAAAASSV